MMQGVPNQQSGVSGFYLHPRVGTWLGVYNFENQLLLWNLSRGFHSRIRISADGDALGTLVRWTRHRDLISPETSVEHALAEALGNLGLVSTRKELEVAKTCISGWDYADNRLSLTVSSEIPSAVLSRVLTAQFENLAVACIRPRMLSLTIATGEYGRPLNQVQQQIATIADQNLLDPDIIAWRVECELHRLGREFDAISQVVEEVERIEVLVPTDEAVMPNTSRVHDLASTGARIVPRVRLGGGDLARFEDLMSVWLNENEQAGAEVVVDPEAALDGERGREEALMNILSKTMFTFDALGANACRYEPFRETLTFAVIPLEQSSRWERTWSQRYLDGGGKWWMSRHHHSARVGPGFARQASQENYTGKSRRTETGNCVCDRCQYEHICDRFNTHQFDALIRSGKGDQAALVADYECLLRKDLFKALMQSGLDTARTPSSEPCRASFNNGNLSLQREIHHTGQGE